MFLFLVVSVLLLFVNLFVATFTLFLLALLLLRLRWSLPWQKIEQRRMFETHKWAMEEAVEIERKRNTELVLFQIAGTSATVFFFVDFVVFVHFVV